MYHLLEKLKQKPERERKQIALAASLGISLLIFFIWLIAMIASSLPADAEGQAVKTSPFQTVKNAAAAGFAYFGD